MQKGSKFISKKNGREYSIISHAQEKHSGEWIDVVIYRDANGNTYVRALDGFNIFFDAVDHDVTDDQHTPGAKLDNGKPRLSLVLGGFSNALQAVGEVGTFGANKYSDNGWLEVKNGLQRYSDAMLRHQFADMAGEDNDQESGLLHAAHSAWNALAVLELKLTQAKK